MLDLACEGGIYGIELARRGAEVVGVEGRAEHVGRARFVAREIGLDNYEICQDDVRNVNRDTYGAFDVVLCLGILYHLDAPDVFEFVHAIAGMTREFALVDTQVSLAAKRSERFAGHEYWGRDYSEHDPGSSPEERERRLRASLDNPKSFWLTVPSLTNLLGDAGFTSVLQVQAPRAAERHADRVALIANMGVHEDVPHNPEIDDPRFRWPERERLLRDEAQSPAGPLKRVARALRR